MYWCPLRYHAAFHPALLLDIVLVSFENVVKLFAVVHWSVKCKFLRLWREFYSLLLAFSHYFNFCYLTNAVSHYSHCYIVMSLIPSWNKSSPFTSRLSYASSLHHSFLQIIFLRWQFSIFQHVTLPGHQKEVVIEHRETGKCSYGREEGKTRI